MTFFMILIAFVFSSPAFGGVGDEQTAAEAAEFRGVTMDDDTVEQAELANKPCVRSAGIGNSRYVSSSRGRGRGGYASSGRGRGGYARGVASQFNDPRVDLALLAYDIARPSIVFTKGCGSKDFNKTIDTIVTREERAKRADRSGEKYERDAQYEESKRALELEREALELQTETPAEMEARIRAEIAEEQIDQENEKMKSENVALTAALEDLNARLAAATE